MRLTASGAAAAALGVLWLGCAFAEEGLGRPYVENWIFFQRNADGSGQWKDEPRLYVPWHLAGGWPFTQRVDAPLVYTNATGMGNPDGSYSAHVGDAFIEEILASPLVAADFRLRTSVRFVFPTGGQKPFGSGQYQWAPGAGFAWSLPAHGVVLSPYVRYFFGFDPQYADVKAVRKLDIYPAAKLALGRAWSLLLYPQNPITYNAASGTWFVPLDVMAVYGVHSAWEVGVGGAVKLGTPSDPVFSYVIDVRVEYRF